LELCGEGPCSLLEITNHLGVHRTTASRLVQTLARRSLLVRDADGRYVIGVRMAGLAQHAIEHSDLYSVAHPHLVALAEDLGYSVHLAVPVRPYIVSVDIVEPSYSIKMPLRIGARVLVNTSGVGKAILAHLPTSEVEVFLDNATWQRYTENTITDREQMKKVLDSVRARGWAFDDCEYEDISNCIAAPVHDYRSVVGAVSITAFRAQADLAALEKHLDRLLATTAAISRGLGWTGRAWARLAQAPSA